MRQKSGGKSLEKASLLQGCRPSPCVSFARALIVSTSTPLPVKATAAWQALSKTMASNRCSVRISLHPVSSANGSTRDKTASNSLLKGRSADDLIGVAEDRQRDRSDVTFSRVRSDPLRRMRFSSTLKTPNSRSSVSICGLPTSPALKRAIKIAIRAHSEYRSNTLDLLAIWRHRRTAIRTTPDAPTRPPLSVQRFTLKPRWTKQLCSGPSPSPFASSRKTLLPRHPRQPTQALSRR